jgi:drug/metabolite transporter (DMT)-like permease
MTIGILAGLITGALWGLTFVGPRLVEPYSAMDLAIGRYSVFCIASLLLMLHPRFRPSGIGKQRIAVALASGSVGYVGNFLACAYAVRYAGGTIPPMIIGIVPVVLAAIGNRAHDGIPWARLAIPLSLIASGVLLVNYWHLLEFSDERSQTETIIGVAWAVTGFAIWVAYGVVNSRIMRSDNPPDTLRWTILQGLGAGLGIVPLTLFVYFNAGAATADFLNLSWQTLNFFIWAVVLGIAGSWVATLCWSVASRTLPLALAAQLVVSETVFGLLYGFVYEGRWPVIAEFTGIGLELAGVIVAIHIFTTNRIGAPKLVAVAPEHLPEARQHS